MRVHGYHLQRCATKDFFFWKIKTFGFRAVFTYKRFFSSVREAYEWGKNFLYGILLHLSRALALIRVFSLKNGGFFFWKGEGKGSWRESINFISGIKLGA